MQRVILIQVTVQRDALTTLEQVVQDADIIGDTLTDMETASKKDVTCYLALKKKLFWTSEPADAVERDLLFHQAVADIQTGRFPIANERDAVKLAAYRLHLNFGTSEDSDSVIKRTLGY